MDDDDDVEDDALAVPDPPVDDEAAIPLVTPPELADDCRAEDDVPLLLEEEDEALVVLELWEPLEEADALLEDAPPDAVPASAPSLRPGWHTPSTHDEVRSQSPVALQVRAQRPSTRVSPSAHVDCIHAGPQAQMAPNTATMPTLRAISTCQASMPESLADRR